MARRLVLAAPAKINLSLAVLGRQPDGFHELAGAMALLELHDDVVVAGGRGELRLEAEGVDGEGVPPGADNLAWRGLRAGLGREPDDVDLMLTKRIPVAAGLGGGSSDAAAAMRVGRSLGGGDESGIDPGEAARIGADVPFFLAGAALAYVTGAGERVEPLPGVAAQHAILAVPPFRLSTAAVFGELRPGDWSRELPPRGGSPGRNDLLAAALRLRPELAGVFAAFRSAGAEPHLTGSGSACFTLTDDVERARHVAAALRAAGLRTIETAMRLEAAMIRHSDRGDEEVG